MTPPTALTTGALRTAAHHIGPLITAGHLDITDVFDALMRVAEPHISSGDYTTAEAATAIRLPLAAYRP